MEPVAQESDWLNSDMNRSSQDSFRPIDQSKFYFGSTQEEFLSTENEQFSSFKPKREYSRSDSKTGAKKKVRFADDQDTDTHSDTLWGYEDMHRFNMNNSCPTDLNLDADISFDTSSQNMMDVCVQSKAGAPTEQPKECDSTNEFVPRTDPSLKFTDNSFRQHSTTPTSNQGNSNPNFTYIMREIIVKKDNDLLSYTFQNTYHDNDMNSSLQRSLRVNNDVTHQMVLEEEERSENRKTGLNFSGKHSEIFNGTSNHIHMTENSAGKQNSYINNNNNNNVYDLPDFNFGRYSHSNHTSPQEFDTNNYQSSQHSDFGNVFSENSDYITSSQHSFSNVHDDEFVPKVFPNNYNPAYGSEHSKEAFSSPGPSILDTSYSSSEFTPITSKLVKQLSLDTEESPRYSKISDTDYL